MNLYHQRVNQVTGGTTISHIGKESESQKHLTRLTRGESVIGITKLQQDKQKHMKKQHVDESITDNVRTHPGHKKHPSKLRNVKRWLK